MSLKSSSLLGHVLLVYSIVLVIAAEISELENYDYGTFNINKLNNNDMDKCIDLCTESYFLLPSHAESQKTCQRGCRFFNIISLRTDRHLNISSDECYESCNDAYEDNDLITSCQVGCKSSLKKKQSELEPVIEMYIEQDAGNVFVMEPDVELEMVGENVDSSQSQRGGNILNLAEYKIPETNIRTMPIEAFIVPEVANNAKQDSTGDWLDCAAKNSGIPKVVLLLAIVGAVFVTIWLSLSSEKKAIDDSLLWIGAANPTRHSEVNEHPKRVLIMVDEHQAPELPKKCHPELPFEIQFGVAHSQLV